MRFDPILTTTVNEIRHYRYLAAGLLMLVALPALADMGMAWALLVSEYWTLPLAIAIELVAIHWIFGFTWKRSVVAALAANAVTFVLGFVLLYPVMDYVLYRGLRPWIQGLTGGGPFSDVTVALAMTALFDTAFELPVLRFGFKAAISLQRALLFLLANALTGAIFLALAIVPEIPARLPVEEVRVLEEYYAPEIRYMRELLDEIPHHLNTEGSEVARFAIPFDREWTRGPAWRETARYRFYELKIRAPNGGVSALTTGRTQGRGRLDEARYTAGDVAAERVVEFWTQPEYTEWTLYRYKIRRDVDGTEFSAIAVFEAPRDNGDNGVEPKLVD